MPTIKSLSARLLRLRQPERGEVVLAQRRIFILPSKVGVVFAIVLLLMLTGAINYTLSLGFILTFLLASLGVTAMLHTFRNLAGLRIAPGKTAPVFAGETAHFVVSIRNPTHTARFRVTLTHNKRESDVVDIPAERAIMATARVPAPKRGVLRPGRMTLSTRFPLGLLNAWSYIEFETHCVVFPRPAPPGLPLPPLEPSDAEGLGLGHGREDFSGLRQYHSGDSPGNIAWKAAAREQGLLTKQFTGTAAAQLWLSLDLSPRHLDFEQKVSQVTRWLLDAHAGGLAYGLKLPDRTIALGTGENHLHRCLEALARL